MQVVTERQVSLGVQPIYHALRVSAIVLGSFSVHVSPCLSVRGTVLVQYSTNLQTIYFDKCY